MGGQSAAQNMRKLKRAPRLTVETAFIPYVQGRLLVAVHAVKFRGNIEGKFLAKDPRSGAFRAVLGPDSFAFSDSFDLNVPFLDTTKNLEGKTPPPGFNGDGHGSKPGEEVPIMARMVLPVNTLELGRRGDNGCATLDLSLIDQDAALEGGKQYCLGSGKIQTASLYYQAVNGAAGSRLPGSKQDSTGSVDIAGSSPWMPVVVDIVDHTLNRVTATAVVSVQFVATAVPNNVLFALDGSSVHDVTLYKETNVNTSKCDTSMIRTQSSILGTTGEAEKDAAKVELLLKQAFISADADKSGTVSSAELLNAIRASQTMSGGADKENVDLFQKMMAALAGCTTGTLTNTSTKELEQTVSKLFLRLDVDGDGSISWWEWRRVLMASMLSIQRFGSFIFCVTHYFSPWWLQMTLLWLLLPPRWLQRVTSRMPCVKRCRALLHLSMYLSLSPTRP